MFKQLKISMYVMFCVIISLSQNGPFASLITLSLKRKEQIFAYLNPYNSEGH